MKVWFLISGNGKDGNKRRIEGIYDSERSAKIAKIRYEIPKYRMNGSVYSREAQIEEHEINDFQCSGLGPIMDKTKIISMPENDPDSELKILRKRVMAQRAELRRLNKIIESRWAVFSAGLYAARMAELREKMIKAFGHQAVYEAEHGDMDNKTWRPLESTDMQRKE
jgi:hypothetical protein